MSDKGNKQELLEKIKSCELRIIALERDRNTQLYSKKHEFRSSYSALEELYHKLCTERKSKRRELQQELSRIKGSVEMLQKMLSNMVPDPAFVEKLKQTMESIETSIMTLKEKQREIYESLLLEEQTATQEINAFEKKLDSWMSAPRAKHVEPEHASIATQKPAPSSMPPSVLAFERFLQQTGGCQEGWDDYDHHVFLKLRGTTGNSNAGFLEAVAMELPTKTPEEIEQHEKWYIEYSTLLESKRKAIEAWKAEKENRKKVKLTEEADATTDAKKSIKQEILAKEREERFSKLSAWKAEQKQRQEKAEEEQLKVELEASKKRERENARRAILKSRVEEYVKSKEANMNEEKEREEARKAQVLAQKKLANKEIEKFRERDMKAVTEKKLKAQAKEEEKREIEKQLQLLKDQVAVKVSRDPARLYKLTAGWEERKKAENSKSEVCLNLPRRAVPSWRQGI